EDYYIQAGQIARKVRRTFENKVKDGTNVLELCEAIENEIEELGGKPAFPCNIGINEVAAHYTAASEDPTTIPPGALVKIDYGVHLEGYIVDTAFSVALSNTDKKIVEEVNRALGEVIKRIKVGEKISKVGEIVDSVAREGGFLVISNLHGHEIKRFNLHSGLSIPNIPNKNSTRFTNGMVVAIEPFFTYSFGKGYVEEVQTALIFKLASLNKAPEELKNYFHSLPFCERWIRKKKIDLDIIKKIPLIRYNVLVEAGSAPVAQRETTLYLLTIRLLTLCLNEELSF
ncbi:MAG: type II methionyl aminopeptidase, partial [Candidatus Brockarchaeota archaeon]|nr:type II methionyl aminopeptidase [Candidatus Brockarchaeota archaeon]